MHDNIAFSQMNTVEDVINILSKLSFNADNFEKVYYNMYLEETPMDITFRQYNSEGIINELTIPNVAKMRTSSYTSEGDPNGKISAPRGSFCVDIIKGLPYYKKEGSDNYGWIPLWCETTLGPQGSSVDNAFQTPNGDGSKLNNLNMNNIKASSNPLNVNRGGTGRRGSTGVSGILKGNGTNPYSIALDNTDYVGGTSNAGIIMYFPPIFGENGKLKIPNGWLICDGSTYSGVSGSLYERLFNVIGIAYGGSGTNFKVPNLINNFVRCINSTVEGTCRTATDVQDSQNKQHVHTAGYSIENSNANHGHGSSNTNKTGSHYHGAMGEQYIYVAGNFGWYDAGSWHWGSHGNVDKDNTLWKTSTDGAHTHKVTVNSANMSHTHTLSGTMGSNGGSEFNVKNMALVPLIKF